MRAIELKVAIFLAGTLIPLLFTVSADGSEHIADQGIFTEQQAKAGQQLYDAACGSCHGTNLMNGTSSAMIGAEFVERWGGQVKEEGSTLWTGFDLGALLDVNIETMPPGLIGTLSNEDQISILGYVLQQNGFPTGTTELTMTSRALGDLSHEFEPTVGRIGREQRLLVWVDRQGNEEIIPAPPRHYYLPRISPDGRHIAAEVIGDKADIWIVDAETGDARQLTHEGTNRFPLWSPYGTRVLYSSDRHHDPADSERRFMDGHQVYWQTADGSGDAERLTYGEHNHGPQKWTPDGKTLSFYEIHPDTYRDIWMLPMAGDRQPWPYLTTPHLEGGIGFSQNGKWLAHTSKETGRYEVVVRAYPESGPEHKVTSEGGVELIWPPGSKELFYRADDKRMAVDITAEDTVKVGVPRVLFVGNYVKSPGSRASWDSINGQRFLVLKKVE